VLDDVDALKAFLHNYGAIWTMLVARIPAKYFLLASLLE